MKLLNVIIFSLLTSTFSINALADGKIEAHDPWVREAPPMAELMAAYLVLHNHTSQIRTLEQVTSPQFKRVEIHRSEIKNGIATMLPVTRVMITTQGSVGFQPNALHLMLIGPKNPMRAGSSVQLKFHFTDGYTLEIDAPVKKADDMADHAQPAMNGNSHDDHHDQNQSHHH